MVMEKEEVWMVKKIIKRCDRKGFVIVDDVGEVFGEGLVDMCK